MSPRVIWYFPHEKKKADFSWNSGMFTDSGIIYINAIPDLFIMEVGGCSLKTISHFFNVILLHELTHWAGESHLCKNGTDDGEQGNEWSIAIEKAMLN